MRAADLIRLNEAYPEALEPTEEDARAAIGIKLPHSTTLEGGVLADFVEQQPYGIGWWAPDPGTSRRILIADQLSCCLASVAGNMTEAALHWLEYLDASDHDSARFAHAVKSLPGGPGRRPAAPALCVRATRTRFCTNAPGRPGPGDRLRSRLSRWRHYRRRRLAAKHPQV